MYTTDEDDQGQYFLWDSQSVTLTEVPVFGIGTASFLQDELEVVPEVDNIFTNDITRRDDILLAVMSLALLLVIQGIVTTILLRTHNGQVSTFSFAVKQVVELAREFRLKRIWEGPRGVEGAETRGRSRRVNRRLVIIASIVVLGTFGLEVLVLFLTERESRDVSNRKVSLELAYPWYPQWQIVRFHNRVSINRPCMALSLKEVEQGKTRVSTCMTTTLGTDAFDSFERATERKRVTIITDVHEYGMEHTVAIGEEEFVNCSGRAYYNLDDEKQRILARRAEVAQVRGKVEVLHKQFIALLFNFYNLEVEDEDMNLERLYEIGNNTKFIETGGQEIAIIIKTVGNKTEVARTSKSRQFISQFEAVVPFGKAALRFAQPVFKAAMAVQIHSGNRTDLFAEGSVREEVSVVWREPIRIINWLSLTIILGVAMLFLALLRLFLKPVATAEIAGLFVKGSVVGTWEGSPLQLDANENPSFRLRYQSRKNMRMQNEVRQAELSVGHMQVPMQNVVSMPDEMDERGGGGSFGFRSTSGDYIFRSAGFSNRRDLGTMASEDDLTR